MSPPYRCKNGPLDSLEELLLVRGVTPQLLFGNDLNRNGTLDGDEQDTGSGLDRGWSAYLTIYSREPNKDSSGNPRIYVNGQDLSGLYDQLASAVSADVAGYLIAYRLYGNTDSSSSSGGGSAVSMTSSTTRASTPGTRGYTTQTTVQLTVTTTGSSGNGPAHPASELTKDVLGLTGSSSSSSSGGSSNRPPQPKALPSLYALINTTVSITTGTGRNQKTTVYASPFNTTDSLKTLLPTLLDKASTRSTAELPARVNINTAPRAVLATLPGLSDTDVQTILDHRPTPSANPDTTFTTPAWLITEANLSPKTVQALEPYVTTQTQVYRLQSLGYFDGGGPAARVEGVIDTNGGQPRILYYRDISSLGRGFDVSGGGS
jgi:hypothetical protein